MRIKLANQYLSAGVLLLLLTPCRLVAQNNTNSKTILSIARTTDFLVTGIGDAENWKQAAWYPITSRTSQTLRAEQWNIPVGQEDGSNVKYKTQFKILYSEKGIYCLFNCEDSAITATIKEDYLNLYDEDVVEAFFWPDTSLPLYFEYELSPLNFELPLLIVNNKGSIMGWKPWLYSGDRKVIHAVAINEKRVDKNRKSWTAEFFIPFALFEPLNNALPKKGTKWRANFYRIDYDHHPVYSSWQLTRKGYHDPEKFGVIQFD
jgi:hypothetical protein